MKSLARITQSSIVGGLIYLASVLGLASASAAPAELQQAAQKPLQDQAQPNDSQWGQQWVRILNDKRGKPLAMQTAIVRYESRQTAADPKIVVDLIGAVHIGDRAYYRQLNRRFRQYDALLYELVAPKGTQVPKGRGTSNTHPLGAMQNLMKRMLEIEHQLEQIDYTRPNFVHADFSPEEFIQSMKDRDEGFAKMFFRMLGKSIAQQSQQAAKGESGDLDFFSALLAQDRPRQLKIAMAKQFESMESMLSGISGPDGSTLITQRNKRALAVLDEQLDAGKKKLGIFYGAGHLSDMHKRLTTRFDLVPVEITWVDAWDLRKK